VREVRALSGGLISFDHPSQRKLVRIGRIDAFAGGVACGFVVALAFANGGYGSISWGWSALAFLWVAGLALVLRVDPRVKHGLIVVEDAAQAHGATLGGRRAGAFGDAAAFSFYPTKNLGGLGDGGAVVSTRQDILEGVRLLRNYGERERYLSVVSGRDSRLDSIQAAILSLRLEKLDADNNRRRAIASYYLEAFDRWGLSDHRVSLPQPVTESASPVYHLFVITTEARETVRETLKEGGIESLIHYPRAIHQHPAYARLGRQPLPVSESLAESVFSIPLHPELSDAEVEHVAEAVGSALASACR
jgi:dTDP-3-amino-3,4,6-trideoxy-alpha-D-glucose transaminase